MGDLKGHAIPGTFFLVFGVWWAVGCLRKYLRSRREGSKYAGTATYALDCCGTRVNRLPMEAFIKILVSSAGMFGEIIAHLPGPIPMAITQHATMYFFFAMSGVVDVSMHYGIPLPPAADYIAMVLAIVVEGLLFANHVHGRSELDIHIHMLLVYVIFLTAVIIALEAKFNKSALLALSRAYLIMLQGSWFWAVGIMLYGHDEGHAWNQDDPMNVMQATIYFSWHCAVHFILLFIMAAILSRCYRGQGEPFSVNPLVTVNQLDKRGNTYGILSIVDSDESDVEFDRAVAKSLLTSS